jgi:hypothetical protein
MMEESTRNYEAVLPGMAESCSVSNSNVSRQFIEACAHTLQEPYEQRFDDLELLVTYTDGMQFAGHHAGTSACGQSRRPRTTSASPLSICGTL